MLRDEVEPKKEETVPSFQFSRDQSKTTNKPIHKFQILKGEKEIEWSWEEKEYRIKRATQRFLEVPASYMVEKDQRASSQLF